MRFVPGYYGSNSPRVPAILFTYLPRTHVHWIIRKLDINSIFHYHPNEVCEHISSNFTISQFHNFTIPPRSARVPLKPTLRRSSWWIFRLIIAERGRIVAGEEQEQMCKILNSIFRRIGKEKENQIPNLKLLRTWSLFSNAVG